MSTAVTMDGLAETSPRTRARITGAFYLATILTGAFAQGYVAERLVGSGDAAATATSILAHESLFRIGFVVYLVEMACQIAMTALFYDLLKPVSRSVARLATIFGLVGCTIKTVSRLFYYAPLLVLGGAKHLGAFGAEQRQALALLLLQVNDQGAAMALIFFGVHALLKGYLILRSTFLPRALGVLSMLGGVGWLAFVWPPLGYRLFPYIAALGLVGSLATIGWLLVAGVNEPRWREQARAATASIWR